MTIRFANPDDAETIVRFVRELAEYEREPDAVEATPAVVRAQLESARPPFECLIAETDDGAIGFALFFTSYSTWRGQAGLWLEDLYVTPAARRAGAGRALLARLARIASERGYARMEWAVLDWNRPAIDFYRALEAEALDEWTTYRLTDGPLARMAEQNRDR